MEAPYLDYSHEPIHKYQTLRIKEALSKPSHYSLACRELSILLRNGYSEFPKNLQSLVFQDTLFAFTLLHEMMTQSAISAANCLLQSAEYALPKQKRALAVKEHRNAVVASKRKSKANQPEEGLALPSQDVLVHIFSFLDLQSLVAASAVCRSWNVAASDNHLWKLSYAAFFSNSDIVKKRSGIENLGVAKNVENIRSVDDIDTEVGIDWRSAFKTSFKETCHRNFKSYRGYCPECSSVVWISGNQCSDEPIIKYGTKHHIKRIPTEQIVDYILQGLPLSDSSSDSDSDTEDASVLKLWAFPREIIW